MECGNQSELCMEKMDRLHEAIESLKETFLSQIESLKNHINRVEAGLLADIQREEMAISEVKKNLYGNGTTGMVGRLKLVEVLIEQNAEHIRQMQKTTEGIRDEIRSYYRLAVSSLVTALVSVLGIFGSKLFDLLIRQGGQ